MRFANRDDMLARCAVNFEVAMSPLITYPVTTFARRLPSLSLQSLLVYGQTHAAAVESNSLKLEPGRAPGIVLGCQQTRPAPTNSRFP